MILNAFMLAFRQIRRNFLRAVLTMLGIIIGVGSVIVMISLGNGTTAKIQSQIASLGSNTMLIFPARTFDTGGGSRSIRFTMREVEAIRARVHLLQSVAPVASRSVVAKYAQFSAMVPATGVTADYFIVGSWELAQGREFTENEYRSGANVCIIGESVNKSLFKNSSAMGSKIRIADMICETVGVLASKGQGGMGNDQDDIILFPLKTFQRSISPSSSLNNISRIMVSVKEGEDSKAAASQISEVLRDMRGITDGTRDSFEIMDTKEIQETVSSTTRMLTLFLGCIAGVSLLVGGIGIMNIMLVSVTERTKEIGTRLAIGALEKEVLLQFLIESVTLSSLGGIIGIVASFFISMAMAYFMNVPFVYNVSVAIIAFVFSAFIGVLFGYLPAKRASRLNPIDALRHE